MRASPEDLTRALLAFPPDGTAGRLQALQAALISLERAAGAEMFMHLPDAWFDPPGAKWRCRSGCVVSTYIKSEVNGAICSTHFAPVLLTFPEDQ